MASRLASNIAISSPTDFLRDQITTNNVNKRRLNIKKKPIATAEFTCILDGRRKEVVTIDPVVSRVSQTSTNS